MPCGVIALKMFVMLTEEDREEREEEQQEIPKAKTGALALVPVWCWTTLSSRT